MHNWHIAAVNLLHCLRRITFLFKCLAAACGNCNWIMFSMNTMWIRAQLTHTCQIVNASWVIATKVDSEDTSHHGINRAALSLKPPASLSRTHQDTLSLTLQKICDMESRLSDRISVPTSDLITQDIKCTQDHNNGNISKTLPHKAFLTAVQRTSFLVVFRPAQHLVKVVVR